MTTFPPSLKRRTRLVVSCLLIVIGTTGGIRAIHAVRAQYLYHETKHGVFLGTKYERLAQTDAQEVTDRAQRVYALYPDNYYFTSYAAKQSLISAMGATTAAEFHQHLVNALNFSRLAIAINPYDSESCMLYALALAEDGRLQEAITFWRDQVLDRSFWNPANHDFMARLYLRSVQPADIKAAVAELPFVSDKEMRDRLRQLKKTLGM